MKIREWADTKSDYFIHPQVLYAGELLEHVGFMFLVDFGVGNAIDKAAQMFTEHLEDVADWNDLRQQIRTFGNYGEYT